MFGLVVLIAAALYCLVMFLSVRGAWRKGLASGGSRTRAFRYAALAFLAVYLPVFWDHIPTLVVHRAMCAKDAGFTAYMDAKKWSAKNAEAVTVVNRLSRNERESSIQAPKTADGFERSISLGGLLFREYQYRKVVSWLSVGRSERRIADARTGEVLAVSIDYGAGPSSPENLRWWNQIESCVVSLPAADHQSVKPVTPRDFLWRYENTLWGEQS